MRYMGAYPEHYCIPVLKFVQNLERFLKRVFQEQTFLPTTTIVRSTENEVELLLPVEVAETQGYRISPLKGCRVSFKVTEYYPYDNEHCDPL